MSVMSDSRLIPLKYCNYEKCAEVEQQGYGFTSAYDEKPYISTFGLGPCIAIVGYNAEYKIGFMYHIDNMNCFHNRNVGQLYYKISTIKKKLDVENMIFEVTLFGATSYVRKDFINYIYSQFKSYNSCWKKSHNIEIRIVKNNIETSNNSTSVCLNTQDGSFYSFCGKKSLRYKNRSSVEQEINDMRMITNSYMSSINLKENYYGKMTP